MANASLLDEGAEGLGFRGLGLEPVRIDSFVLRGYFSGVVYVALSRCRLHDSRRCYDTFVWFPKGCDWGFEFLSMDAISGWHRTF